ncbi:hypothetical protein [Gracilimonas tropica]|uniref:hypothetical protein n=1 Tax=Gracilimonas tropica TaxID=454600 RepID=UPI000362E31D|nr:hypothetical protein [Gracilimonas tropica]
MSSEFRKLRGERMQLKQDLKTLEIRADNHIINIRNKIDPLLDFDEIEIDHAEQSVISLKVIITEAKKIRERLDKISKLIGDE